jgi:hypothetical protein
MNQKFILGNEILVEGILVSMGSLIKELKL